MKIINNYQLCSLKLRVSIVAFVVICTSNSAKTQNVSYNLNSIPIGGTLSTGVGHQTLSVNTGAANTAYGYQALHFTTFGANNTAMGYRALYSNTTGEWNTAHGYQALVSNIGGTANTAIGHTALSSNTAGYSNTATGYKALINNLDGSVNTATGVIALYANTTGSYNTATGDGSLGSNTTGSNNTAVGYNTLSTNLELVNTTGSNNTAIGFNAGYRTFGSGNVFIGANAGSSEPGSNKFYLCNDSTQTLMYGSFSTKQILMGVPYPLGYTFKGNRTLNVVGGILADSVRIAPTSAWADYVFDKNYKLMAVSALAVFIEKNKHLPGIPSSAEVSANGVELTALNVKLLEKIEELFLYMIEQNRKISDQQIILSAQEKQIEKLKMLIVKPGK